MAHYTPGPWQLVQECVDPEWHIVTAKGGRMMANVHIEDGNQTDADNARLVAAAPKLAEALRDLLKYSNSYSDAMAELGRGAEELGTGADSVSVAGMARAALLAAGFTVGDLDND